MSVRRRDEPPAKKKPKIKEFDDEQSLNKNETLFTLEEKQNFLRACQENGLNIIYDLKKLKEEYLPNRSEVEIKFLIDVYERKSKYKKENNDFEETPLEVWYSLVNHMVRSQIKKEDSSMILIDLMNKYSNESNKFNKIYSYIKELMEGKYPSKLSAYDSIVLLCLIDTLSDFIQTQNLSTLKDYIIELYKQLTERQTKLDPYQQAFKRTNEQNLEYLKYFEEIEPNKLRSDIQLAAAQLNEQNSKQLNNVQCDQQVATTINDSILKLSEKQNPLFQYNKLPRIDKIRECLNPLGISIEILKDLHSKIESNHHLEDTSQ